jgi:hypothetical protein
MAERDDSSPRNLLKTKQTSKMNNELRQYVGAISVFIVTVMSSAPLLAQRGGEIGGFVGYQMLGRSGEVNIIDDWNFGFQLNMPVRPGIKGKLK